MKLAKWIVLFIAVLLGAEVARTQAQTKEELYSLLQLGKDPQPHPINVSFHWIQFGLNHMQQIQHRPGFQQTYEQLYQVLQPVKDIQLQAHQIGTPELLEAADRLLIDEQIADRVFHVLGADYCAAETYKSVVSNLESLVESERRGPFQQSNILHTRQLADILNLVPAQLADLENIAEEAEDQLRKESQKLLENQTRIVNNRWEQILNELRPGQSSLARRMLGQPIRWHLDFDQPKARLELFPGIGFSSIVSKTHEKRLAEVFPEFVMEGIFGGESFAYEKLGQLSSRELKDKGFSPRDYYLEQAITHKVVQRELELIDEQRKDIDDLRIAEDGNRFIITFANRIHELLEGEAAVMGGYADILTPSQKERMLQIELQFRLNPQYDSTFGILDPHLVHFLAVDKQQVVAVEAIGNALTEVSREFENQFDALLKKIADESFDKCIDVLNEEQKSQFNRIRGRARAL